MPVPRGGRPGPAPAAKATCRDSAGGGGGGGGGGSCGLGRARGLRSAGGGSPAGSCCRCPRSRSRRRRGVTPRARGAFSTAGGSGKSEEGRQPRRTGAEGAKSAGIWPLSLFGFSCPPRSVAADPLHRRFPPAEPGRLPGARGSLAVAPGFPGGYGGVLLSESKPGPAKLPGTHAIPSAFPWPAALQTALLPRFAGGSFLGDFSSSFLCRLPPGTPSSPSPTGCFPPTQQLRVSLLSAPKGAFCTGEGKLTGLLCAHLYFSVLQLRLFCQVSQTKGPQQTQCLALALFSRLRNPHVSGISSRLPQHKLFGAVGVLRRVLP